MSRITEEDWLVFAQAENRDIDNFTEDEQKQIHAIASQLRTVMEAAKKRWDLRLMKIGG